MSRNLMTANQNQLGFASHSLSIRTLSITCRHSIKATVAIGVIRYKVYFAQSGRPSALRI